MYLVSYKKAPANVCFICPCAWPMHQYVPCYWSCTVPIHPSLLTALQSMQPIIVFGDTQSHASSNSWELQIYHWVPAQRILLMDGERVVGVAPQSRTVATMGQTRAAKGSDYMTRGR